MIVAETVIEVPLELPLDAYLPEQVSEANEQLDEASAIGELYGVRVIERIVRARNAGRAIVDEATRRDSEIIVMGGPRRVRLAAGKRAIFGDTVDFVLKHAPCRVMVAAAKEQSDEREALPARRVAARAHDRGARLRDPRRRRRVHGGGTSGFLIGALFVALGSGRLYLLRKRQ